MFPWDTYVSGPRYAAVAVSGANTPQSHLPHRRQSLGEGDWWINSGTSGVIESVEMSN